MDAVFVRSRLLHTMLRVADLERSLAFYTTVLEMKLLRRRDYPGGRFTLAFVGYDHEDKAAVLELTQNWGRKAYEKGTAYGHVAISVPDIGAACAKLQSAGVPIVRAPGPMKLDTSEVIAFIEDPDGYQIELIEHRATGSSQN